MSALEEVKQINQRTKDLVYGYTAKVQNSFPSDIVFYTIPKSIIHWILLYFYIGDEFDEENMHSTYTLNDDKSAVTKNQSSNSGSLFLTRKARFGVHSWIFKLIKVDGSLFSMTIGIWKTKYQIDTRYAVRSRMYNGKVYGWMLMDDAQTYLINDAKYEFGLTGDYAKSCGEGDIVEMILDLDKLQLRYKVNGNNYGIAFENIEQTEYIAAVSMFKETDCIQLIAYQIVS